MPAPDLLGASGRYLEIDLVTGSPTFPLMFRPLFEAAYPNDGTFAAQAVSRTIVALGGSGNLDLISAAPGAPVVTMAFAQGEANAVKAIGIDDAPVGITSIKVML